MGRGQGVTVTNDGATILKSLYIDNPAAKVLVGMQGYVLQHHATWLNLPQLQMLIEHPPATSSLTSHICLHLTIAAPQAQTAYLAGPKQEEAK